MNKKDKPNSNENTSTMSEILQHENEILKEKLNESSTIIENQKKQIDLYEQRLQDASNREKLAGIFQN